MIKKLVFTVLTALVIVSCANNTKKQETDEKTIVETSVIDFSEKATDLVGSTVMISATVNHVCTHGGKKMFLITEGSDASVKIVPSEKIAAFNTDLVGSEIQVTGFIEELIIDEAYLLEWESELLTVNESGEVTEIEGDGHGTGKGEVADMGEHIAAKASITNYRKQMSEGGVDHLAFYTIVCEKFEVLKQAVIEE
ncbi:MAG: hypothetical protein GY834_03835 [Bacteroidetes bacterium]|nr:hypothetical protein [Bacteroidota bacterium]